MPGNIVHGSDNPETIDAADGVTEGVDAIYGHGGADTIFGLGGNDSLNGGAGADHLDGGADSDSVGYLDSASGVIVDLASGIGQDGEAEGDTYTSIERAFGSSYSDILLGNGGDNHLWGSSGDDALKGGGGADHLHGGDDDDTLTGGAGGDLLNGNSGSDTAAYINSPQGVVVSLMAHAGSGGDAEGDTLHETENLTGSGHADLLQGDAWVNVLSGLDGPDTLKGMGGADTLIGGNGHDVLNGGTGHDTMSGGFGDDTYWVDSLSDDVFESAGQGSDTVRTSVSWILNAGSDVETLRTTDDNGITALSLTGNGSGNNIIGNNGDNTLNGRGGGDQMAGRGGNDIYLVDNAGDEVIESAGQGMDTVRTSVTWTLTEGADVETLSTTSPGGIAAIDLTGNSSGNVVVGNNGANTINGGAGDDELIGRGGQDRFLFNTALDAAINVDELSDFNVTDDTIVLENTIFGALSAGDLAAERFVVGAVAQDASDCIIYDDSTGALYYDSDGTGAAAAIQFARVNAGTALTHLDFLVV